MLSKKSRPLIGILTGSFLSGNKSEVVDFSTSPRIHSPRKSFENCGVGLGIVAALENPADGRSEFPAVISRNLSRSSPIPVSSPKSPFRITESDSLEEEEEEYTIVTRHLPNKSYHTKVYGRGGGGNNSLFQISPEEGGRRTPEADFLSSCQLCGKKLDGKDIYMYRGEKGFCSTECRYREMVMEERREKCRSAAVEVKSSPCANGSIFSTGGILAI